MKKLYFLAKSDVAAFMMSIVDALVAIKFPFDLDKISSEVKVAWMWWDD